MHTMQAFLQALARCSDIGDLPLCKLVIEDLEVISNESVLKQAFSTLSHGSTLSSLQLRNAVVNVEAGCWSCGCCACHRQCLHETLEASRILMQSLSQFKTLSTLQLPSQLWLPLIHCEGSAGCKQLAHISGLRIWDEDGEVLLGRVVDDVFLAAQWKQCPF